MFDSFFGELKTTKEINQEFPSKFKLDYFNSLSHEKIISLKNEGVLFLEENKKSPLINKYLTILNEYDPENKVKDLWLSYNVNPISYCDNDPNGDELNYFINNIIHKILTSIITDLQDEFRLSKGLPKIGEGWISETELYYLLKDNLPNEKIIHHGKPKWLGRQHVDIWFPEHKIGIEYQGLQHDQPVEFFGGEKSFLKGKERDEKKKRLFKENNSTLIEVRKGYDLQEVIDEIQKYIVVD